MASMIEIDGDPVVPSFRVARGEVKMQLDLLESYVIMHPYDIVQKLGEAGQITQAFAALEGFLRREIDIKADAAIDKLYRRK
jgi:hypothetical protein